MKNPREPEVVFSAGGISGVKNNSEKNKRRSVCYGRATGFKGEFSEINQPFQTVNRYFLKFRVRDCPIPVRYIQ